MALHSKLQSFPRLTLPIRLPGVFASFAVLALPARSRRFSAAVVAAVLAGLSLPASPAIADDEAETFRIMTYNIRHCRGLDDVLYPERTAAVIREQQADVVGLQEMDRGVRRTDRRDLPAELGKLTGMTAIFEKNHPVQGGEYGNMILTRFPHRDVKNTHLPIVVDFVMQPSADDQR